MFQKIILIFFFLVSTKADITRTIGGELISDSDTTLPWLVQFQDGDKPLCSASLISKRFILTARHCVVTLDLKDMRFKARGSDIVANAKNVYFPIIENSTSSKKDNEAGMDIAVIEIDRDILISQYANLPETNTIDDLYDTKDSSILFGYGVNDLLTTEEIGKQLEENKIQPTKLTLSIMDRQTCDNKLEEDLKAVSQVKASEIIPRMICADNIADGIRKGKKIGMCAGDSGGPLVVFKNNEYTQIGVVSGYLKDGISPECGENTGQYGNISFHSPWIRSVLNGNVPPSTYEKEEEPNGKPNGDSPKTMTLFYLWLENLPKNTWHMLGLGANFSTNGENAIEGYSLYLDQINNSIKSYRLYFYIDKKWKKYTEQSTEKTIQLNPFTGLWIYIKE